MKDLPKVKMPAHKLKPGPSIASLRINICTSWAGSHPLKWHRLSRKKKKRIWGYVENLGKMMQTLREKILKYFVRLQWTRVGNYCQGSRVSGKDWKTNVGPTLSSNRLQILRQNPKYKLRCWLLQLQTGKYKI